MQAVSFAPASQQNAASLALAEHVAGFPVASLPPATRHAARRALLDGAGVMMAAARLSAEAAPFLSLAAGSPGPCGVLGTTIRTTASLAALANGALAHALDFEDAFDAAPCHPNASLLPAVLAAADARGDVGMDELLAAIAIGCDIVCRIALSLPRPMEAGGWYPPPILGGFGAVAAVARILRLDARQVLDAWSLMLCRTGCPGEIKHDAGTVLRAVREAFPAQTAVEVCTLAAGGVRGFDRPLEGQAGFYALYAGGGFDADALLGGLGTRFWIERLSFKRWPACRGTHGHIQAVRAIRARMPFAPAQVASVALSGSEVQRMLAEPVQRKRAPETVIDAKFSLPFTVAAAIVQGDVTLDSYAVAALRDPAVLDLARRVTFTADPALGRDRAAEGTVRIALADGQTDEETVITPEGAPDAPLADAVLLEKFVDCAARGAAPLPPARARALGGAILDGTATPAALTRAAMTALARAPI